MLSKPHEWDATQMPVNVMDTVYRSYQQEVLPECLKRGIGVIGMKALGGGYPQGTFLKSAGLTAEECYRFALSQPVSVQVCGINSMEHLQQDIEIGRSWKPMPEDEVKTLVARVREEAGDGRHELFKSTTLFDGPHHVKQHGFAASST
jgi:predicted aldo/keto reductase-like oxidoreductase